MSRVHCAHTGVNNLANVVTQQFNGRESNILT